MPPPYEPEGSEYVVRHVPLTEDLLDDEDNAVLAKADDEEEKLERRGHRT